jgi:hypothetical protein
MLIVEKGRGLFVSWLEFSGFGFIFEWEKCMDRVLGGPGTEATAVAHRRMAETVPKCAEPHRG